MRSVHRADVVNVPVPAPPTDVAWHPDGERLAIAMVDRIGVYDLGRSEWIATLERPAGNRPEIFFGVAWDPEARRIAASGLGGVLVWDPQEPGERWFTRRPFLPGVRWDSTGSRLICCQDQLFAFDGGTGEPLLEAGQGFNGLGGFSLDPASGEVLVTRRGEELVLADGMNGDVRRVIATFASMGTATGLSPTGDAAAVTGIDGALSVFELSSGGQRFRSDDHLERLFDLDWHPHGDRIATASEDGTIRIYNAVNGARLEVFNGHTGSARRVAWSPDGTRLASASWNGEVLVWRADEASAIRRLTGNALGFSETPGDLSYDGARGVLWASAAAGTSAWSVATGKRLEMHSGLRLGKVRARGDLFATDIQASSLNVLKVGQNPAPGRTAFVGDGTLFQLDWLGSGSRILCGNRAGLFLAEVPAPHGAPLRLSRVADVDGQVLHLEGSHRGFGQRRS